VSNDFDLIRNQCHRYGIRQWNDAMWMDEFDWNGFRYDVYSMDIGTWTVRGFEIKTSRNDFLGDKKWENYLPFVHYFFFATLPGIIERKELPSEIGLLEIQDGKLKLCKRAKRLQPKFVRHTYGEHLTTRVLLNWIRNIHWREARQQIYCKKCGTPVAARDGRYSSAYAPLVPNRD